MLWSWSALLKGGDERGGDLRDDSIAEGVQFIHATGYPIHHPLSFDVGRTPLCNIHCDQFREPSMPDLEALRQRPLGTRFIRLPGSTLSSGLSAVQVGAPEKSLSLVGSPDACSRQIGTPAGISTGFQVSANSGEPFEPIFARNLFSKDCCRAALGDKVVKSGPEVSFVGMTFPPSSDRKRLTRATAGPDWNFIRVSGEFKSIGPSADAGEEMGLGVAAQVVGSHIDDAPLVNVASGDVSGCDEVSEPSRCVGGDFIVICGHLYLVGFSVCVLEPDKPDTQNAVVGRDRT
jgi:hypothetical protein